MNAVKLFALDPESRARGDEARRRLGRGLPDATMIGLHNNTQLCSSVARLPERGFTAPELRPPRP